MLKITELLKILKNLKKLVEKRQLHDRKIQQSHKTACKNIKLHVYEFSLLRTAIAIWCSFK